MAAELSGPEFGELENTAGRNRPLHPGLKTFLLKILLQSNTSIMCPALSKTDVFRQVVHGAIYDTRHAKLCVGSRFRRHRGIYAVAKLEL